MAHVLASARRHLTARRHVVALAIIAAALACHDDGPTGLLKPRSVASHAAAPGPSVEFYIHGSVEDWPVFMGNVAYASVTSGRKVDFIITTAGDGGQPAAYWQKRETAGLTSIDSILGAGAWTCASQTVNGHPIRRCTKANVTVYFMRMPDGNYYDGTGFGFGSLSILRDQGVPTKPIDNSTTYVTWTDFTNTIRAIISNESAGQSPATVQINAPDYDRTINPGDHPDNAATSDAVHAAMQTMGWTLVFYVDYQTENMPVNLSQADHDTKQKIFLAYNNVMVKAGYPSDANDPDIAQWLWRTYFRVASPIPPAAPTALGATANSKSRIDVQWTDNANNETGFYVERAPDVAGGAGTFAQIGTVAANTTTYSDLTVSPGTTYWYRVRAYNDGGLSTYSNAASAKTLTSQPLPYRGDAYIVAHEDDWQIFAGDHAYSSFQTAASMLFIFATAGDGGNPVAYWSQREKGTLASMDAVIGGGTWACATKTIRTHPIWRCNKGSVVAYFMRMPDGNFVDGTGFGYGSISNLRGGTPTTTIDGSTTYTTWTDFYTTIGAIVDFEFDGQSSPYVKVNAQEYDKTKDPNDHPDHNTTGDAVRTVAASHNWDLTYYVGYDTENRPVNITDAQHTQKLQIWTAYDNTMVAGGYPSDLGDSEYQAWVARTYFRTINGTGTTVAAPSGLTAAVQSTSEIDLVWLDNSTNETGFSIERAPDANGAPGTFAVIGTVGANVTTFANTGLTAGTTYWYRVQALGSSGNSGYSNSVSASTQQPLPAAPTALALTAPSSTQASLSWTDNSNNETGFSIERAPDVAGGAGTFTVVGTVGANVTTYSDAALAPNTTYWYRVRAFNAGGNSGYSNTTSVTTLPAPPTAPSALTLTPTSSTQINLAWTDNSNNETGFSIERAPDNAGAPGTYAVIASVGANVVTYSNTGLTANTTYWYRVQATGVGGSSGYSNATSATTLSPPPPAAPTALTLTPTSASQINLSWTDNASDETGFSIERAPDVAGGAGTWSVIATVGANVTTYANTGLSAGTIYWYRVRAFNANGNSLYSNTASATTLLPPAAPSGLTASAASASQINLSWVDNSSDEASFSIERAPDNAGAPGTFAPIASVPANTTTYSNTGLSASSTYWYRVQAVNANGVSVYSNAVAGTTLGLPPAAPTALTLTAVSPSQINLSWTDNASNETGFTIERAPDNAGAPGTFAAIATVAANATSYSSTGLSGGTTYWYRVQAFNANGVSAYSNVASAATPVPPPTAPTGLSATAASSAEIDLAWTDNASNETGFRIERAPDAGGVAGTYTEIATVGANVTTYASTGLTGGGTYWYRVRAYNVGGTSGYTNEASATTPLVKPLAPTGLTATATSSSTISLAWTDNATNETGYLIERAPDNGGVAGTYAQVASIAVNSTSWSDAGLASGTKYWYRVRAAGQANSDYSNEATATTTVPLPPNAPSNVVAQTISTSEIDLTWTDNAVDETSYTVQRAPDAGGVPGTYATIATLGANVTAYNNTGLTASTTYWYRVRADNANGSSAWVETKATTLSGPPAAPTTFTAKATQSALTATLAWKDNATNETGYRIERAPDVGGVAGAYTEIATVGANVTSYTATGLTGFTTYWFRVRAYNGAGTSSYSNAASMLTALPTDLTVDPFTFNGQLGADVEWFAGSGAKVDIYRDGVKIVTGAVNNGSYYDLGRTAGVTYVYQICNAGFTGAAQCSNTWSISF